jgi:hypothetical protein
MVLTFYFPRGVNECKTPPEQGPKVSEYPRQHPGFLDFRDVERNIGLISDWALPVAGSHYCFQHHQWFQRLFGQCAQSTARDTQTYNQSALASSQSQLSMDHTLAMTPQLSTMSHQLHSQEDTRAQSSASERTEGIQSCSSSFTTGSQSGSLLGSTPGSEAGYQRSWSLSNASDTFCMDNSMPVTAQNSFDTSMLESSHSVPDWSSALTRLGSSQSNAEPTQGTFAFNWLTSNTDNTMIPSSPTNTCVQAHGSEMMHAVRNPYASPSSPFDDMTTNSQRQMDISAVGNTFTDCFRNVNRSWTEQTTPTMSYSGPDGPLDGMLGSTSLSMGGMPNYSSSLAIGSTPTSGIQASVPLVQPTTQYPTAFQNQVMTVSSPTRNNSFSGSCCVHELPEAMEIDSPTAWHPNDAQLCQNTQVEQANPLVQHLHPVQALGLDQLADAAQAAQLGQNSMPHLQSQPRMSASHPNYGFVQSRFSSKCVQHFPENTAANAYNDLQWPNWTKRILQPLPSQFEATHPNGSRSSSNAGLIHDEAC